MSGFQSEKKLVLDFFNAIDSAAPDDVYDVLKQYTTKDYDWECVYPFLAERSAEYAARVFWKPFKEAVQHIQRRKDIFIAGCATDDGQNWVMSMGQFMGLFNHEFLGIRPTYKMQHLQFIEFNCVVDGKIAKTALFIDLIGFMQESGVNPLPPETGHYFVYPGPMEHNGLLYDETDPTMGQKTMKIVTDMITGMYTAHAMESDTMRASWAEDMIWYGPCGIGASYTIPGYQHQHQLPFRQNLNERKSLGRKAFFSEGNFACFYSALNISSKGGWLGMTGGQKHVLMRGDVDVYYCKDGKISENWCYIDLPNWLHEQGLDIFERTASIYSPKLNEP